MEGGGRQRGIERGYKLRLISWLRDLAAEMEIDGERHRRFALDGAILASRVHTLRVLVLGGR